MNKSVIIFGNYSVYLGIGGCWNLAISSEFCGKFAVQLDSDDLYSSPDTLQKIVDAFHQQKAAMIVVLIVCVTSI